jgi:hypothetical protein
MRPKSLADAMAADTSDLSSSSSTVTAIQSAPSMLQQPVLTLSPT